MADRISDLGTVVNGTKDYVLEIEKADGSTPATEKITVENLMSLGKNSKTNIPLIEQVGGTNITISNNDSDYLVIGNSVVISLQFVLTGDETDPTLTTNETPMPGIKHNQILNCVIDSTPTHCRVISEDPLHVKITGTFVTSDPKFIIINGTLL